MSILIGTSVWHYRHWIGPYYAPKMPGKEFLARYVQDFSTVASNNSFYRLPSPEDLADRRKAAPTDFRFAISTAVATAALASGKIPTTQSSLRSSQ
jgi:uncharacterized protein YecE (DUF72 family)